MSVLQARHEAKGAEEGHERMNVRITRCSEHSCWWRTHLFAVITVLWTDQYGHWTRDTGPMRLLQWVPVADTTPTFGGIN
jgi:hypothetical protein